MTKKYKQGSVNIKRRKSRLRKIVSFFLVIFVLSCLFFAGKEFANLLTNKVINIFGTGKICLKSLNYYAINFGEFENEEDALKCSIWTASSGGSAYMYKTNKYMVFGQLYLNINDAETVLNNFSKDLTYAPNLSNFKTKSVRFNINNVSSSDKNRIEHDINFINKTIKNVLETSNNLDKNLISTATASNKINSLKSDVRIAKLELMNINSNYNSDVLNRIINYFVIMEESLDICTTKLLVEDNYGSVCKYCACELFFNYYDFVKNFDK